MKSQQLQIRVTPAQKEALKRLANAAGQDVSSYVLSRALPEPAGRFASLLRQVASEESRRFALAELNDLLSGLSPAQLPGAVENADLSGLSDYLRNYVAAMVELAANRASVPPPAWAAKVPPLETPHFAVPMKSLRLHLLKASPTAFKRRNLFVDSSLGDRV